MARLIYAADDLERTIGTQLLGRCRYEVLVGGGLASVPVGVRLDLELLDQRRFGNGVVHLHHRVAPSPGDPDAPRAPAQSPG